MVAHACYCRSYAYANSLNVVCASSACSNSHLNTFHSSSFFLSSVRIMAGMLWCAQYPANPHSLGVPVLVVENIGFLVVALQICWLASLNLDDHRCVVSVDPKQVDCSGSCLFFPTCYAQPIPDHRRITHDPVRNV